MTTAERAEDAPVSETRTRLLRAAAHLFARKGIDGVRNHEIHTLAGQRNESALHYHFGSRWNIVSAILEENELLAAPLVAAAEGSLTTPEGVVAFLVARLALGLEAPEGRDWLRIVSELMARFPYQESGFGSGTSAQLADVADRLVPLLPALPRPILQRRTIAMVRFMTSQMADRARALDEEAPEVIAEHEFLDELVSMSLGLLTAPLRTRK